MACGRTFSEAEALCYECVTTGVVTARKDARDEALEEAARVADEYSHRDCYGCCESRSRCDIAAGIRALKSKP
jgi:hypothetical protein